MSETEKMELLLASSNGNKLAELRALLEPRGVRVLEPADVGGLPEVEEDQPDFTGNATKKASSAALASGRWTLADDSGLAVDHLDGAPGVHSARYAGGHGDAAANNRKLLAELDGVPDERRGAQFVCALTLARPDGSVAAEFQGICRGRILHEARGTAGFGYDPLFLFTEPGFAATDRGFAELPREAKSAVSHRGRALRELANRLENLLTPTA